MALSLTLSRRRSFALASASVLVGCIVVIALLAVAELVVRGISNVNFNGISANLFSPNRFGASTGNTPEISAVSFGTEVFTDANGFRVPGRDYRYPQEFEGSILILGDSVAFGPGVEESETFAGLLRLQNPRWSVYNAAVIGHATPDYPNVLAAVLEKTSPSKVLLFLCLNDISTASAAELEKAIVNTAAASTPAASAPMSASAPADSSRAVNAIPPVPDRAENLVEKLRTIGMASSFNEFLRDKSKLYLLMKGILTDPSRRHFLSDYQNYLDNGAVEKRLRPLEAVSTVLKKRNIEFTVVLAPYEYQLRHSRPASDPTDVFLPQRVIRQYLRANGISFVDTSPEFLALASKQPKNYFLSFDPMHFSARGHAEMVSILQARGLAVASVVSPR